MSWTSTYTSKKYDILSPRVNAICVEDIAHALGNVCRFGGHCKFFYSVAQHSTLCADVALNVYKDPKLAQHVLLHDASEAYLGDMVGPLKYLLAGQYEPLEDLSMRAIYRHFGLEYEDALDKYRDKIKEIDLRMLFTEKSVLFSDKLRWNDEDKYEKFKVPDEVFIKVSTPERDKQEFKKWHYELFKNMVII